MPGDRIKQVHWLASLRLGRLYVTQHHPEKNADVVLMLDTLAQVGAAPDTTLDLGVRAAASLAAAYLAGSAWLPWESPRSGGRCSPPRLASS